MKHFFVIAMAMGFLFGCKTETTPTETSLGDSAKTSVGYAYTIDQPADNWLPGDMNNLTTVLNALKANETGDIATCMKGFADTIKIAFDSLEGKYSNDSLKALFTAGRSALKSLTIKMDDWESVISKDKKSEYVSLWYKEIWTDKAGKTDSLDVMDDARISKGKIVSLNQKTRHYAVKK